LRLSPLR